MLITTLCLKKQRRAPKQQSLLVCEKSEKREKNQVFVPEDTKNGFFVPQPTQYGFIGLFHMQKVF
jgi:hypothetical protein